VESANFERDELKIRVFNTREEMGRAAAEEATERIKRLIKKNGAATLVFAAAPSQNEFLKYLRKSDTDWTKVRAFHMDEYIGLPRDAPAGFGNFLRRAIFDKVELKEIHYLWNGSDSAEKACEKYEKILKKYPPDLVFLGVGENGHLAFNDPPVADFNDPKGVKIVKLDNICRMQQVNDGCFNSIDEVPTHAITLTMSAIIRIPEAIAIVPGIKKAGAIDRMLNGAISTSCPASILRQHKNTTLYLDADSSSLVLPK